MRRAAIIITDKESVELYWAPYWANAKVIYTSEQLLADLRTLAALPDDLALAFTDPRLRYADVQVDLDDWEEAKAAAARVRALLPKEGGEDE